MVVRSYSRPYLGGAARHLTTLRRGRGRCAAYDTQKGAGVGDSRSAVGVLSVCLTLSVPLCRCARQVGGAVRGLRVLGISRADIAASPRRVCVCVCASLSLCVVCRRRHALCLPPIERGPAGAVVEVPAQCEVVEHKRCALFMSFRAVIVLGVIVLGAALVRLEERGRGAGAGALHPALEACAQSLFKRDSAACQRACVRSTGYGARLTGARAHVRAGWSMRGGGSSTCP